MVRLEQIEMVHLEQLVQDKQGQLYRRQSNEVLSPGFHFEPTTGMFTMVVPTSTDISSFIDALTERKSVLIPPLTNAYVASEFNGKTQHARENSETGERKMCSVYAIQFYFVCWEQLG